MGRMIAAHLEREGCRHEGRFEVDSYVSIMAMVARGMGWSILTPLGVMCGGAALDRVEIAPLPMAPLARRISLTARRDGLHEMPAEIAARLRPLIETRVVAPSRARMPWLGDGLRVL